MRFSYPGGAPHPGTVHSRTHRDTVCVKFDGRGPLRIKAGPGRLGTLADHIKAAAPHVTIVPPGP